MKCALPRIAQSRKLMKDVIFKQLLRGVNIEQEVLKHCLGDIEKEMYQ